MPSLVKTLRRWYWTVRELMNSRLPISGLDRPSRSRATRASWNMAPSGSAARPRSPVLLHVLVLLHTLVLLRVRVLLRVLVLLCVLARLRDPSRAAFVSPKPQPAHRHQR